MRKSFAPRLPSPAMAVALIALFTALGGTGYAASQLGHAGRAAAKPKSKRHRGSNDGRSDAYQIAAFFYTHKSTLVGPRGVPGPAGAQGATGSQGATGPQGPAGAPATKLFAVVMANGTLDTSSPGVQVTHAGTGVYQVNFGQDISHCATLADIGAVPVYSSPGSATGRTVGYVLADHSSAGASLPTSNYPSADTAEIHAFSASGDAPADTAFNLAVFC